MRQHPGIAVVVAAALFPGGPVGRTRFRAEGMTDDGTMSMFWVDHDFIRTMSMKLTAGRMFQKEIGTDASETFIVNEEAVRQMGWTGPSQAVGKAFEVAGGRKGRIIGVVEDFHFASMTRRIEPAVLYIWPWLYYILIKTQENSYPSMLNDLKRIWQEYDPDYPFSFYYLDDGFDRFTAAENRLGHVTGIFSVAAVFLACFGLFSLAAHAVEQRTKEVGIRKALGASIPNLFLLLSLDFTKWIIAANAFAWPVAYFAMNCWLQNYAYRTHMMLWTLVLAAASVFAMALATVSFHTIKVARMNPVESLWYE